MIIRIDKQQIYLATMQNKKKICHIDPRKLLIPTHLVLDTYIYTSKLLVFKKQTFLEQYIMDI